MRLIHTESLRLESFNGPPPRYAILSHTWEYDEVLFEDLYSGSREFAETKYGFAKLKGSCLQARKNGYDYIWIDTCCIDKSSSAELSEAINSMFKWYRAAKVCYAYLADVNVGNALAFERSKWFSRGWTLQELIAPDQVEFYDQAWNKIGERNAMAGVLSRITSIDKLVLSRGGSGDCDHFLVLTSDTARTCLECGANLSIEGILSSYSIATRMGWAAGRVTTREEDIAYCLLGVLDVNLPLLYGEGNKAFLRLQEELIRTSSDQSILAHSHPGNALRFSETDLSSKSLATSPAQFRLPYSVEASEGKYAMSINNQGLTVDLLMCPCITRDDHSPSPATPRSDVGFRDWLGILECSVDGNLLSRPALLLEMTDAGENTFQRAEGNLILKLTPHNAAGNAAEGEVGFWRGGTHQNIHFYPQLAKRKTICLRSGGRPDSLRMTPFLSVIQTYRRSHSHRLFASYPPFSTSKLGESQRGRREYMLSSVTWPGSPHICGILYFAVVALGRVVSGKSGVFVLWGLKGAAHEPQLKPPAIKIASTPVKVNNSEATSGPVPVIVPPPVPEDDTASGSGANDNELKTPWCAVVEWDDCLTGVIDPAGLNSEVLGAQAGKLLGNGSSFLSLLPPLAQRMDKDMKEIVFKGTKTQLAVKIRPCSFLGREYFELLIDTDRMQGGTVI